MISGFVGFHSHKFSNLLYLLLQTFFYNYGIAFCFIKVKPRIVKDLNYFIYPMFISWYWYFNAYFILYFFLPLINSGIKSMNKKELEIFNLSIFMLFSLFNQIKHYSIRFRNDFLFVANGFSYIWLIILYCFGSYFGKYNDINNNSKKFLNIFMMLFCSFFICIFEKYNINI